jgi:AraC-like DNA-binding protein
MAPVLAGQLVSDAPIRLELPNTHFPMDRIEFPWITIEFDISSTRSALIIPADVLAHAMPAADAATAEACAQQCENLLQTRRRRRGLGARVRARLVRDPGRLPSMAAIAAELCVTERTLHRRLAAEHTSYRALVDEVRVALAAALLESGLSVEETARQLGYSESAAFSRAFTRWTGTTPSKHRPAHV